MNGRNKMECHTSRVPKIRLNWPVRGRLKQAVWKEKHPRNGGKIHPKEGANDHATRSSPLLAHGVPDGAPPRLGKCKHN